MLARRWFFFYAGPAGAAPPQVVGSGELDPRLWWELYYCHKLPLQVPETEPLPIEGYAAVTGVSAAMELGRVQVIVTVPVRALPRHRPRVGWVTVRPDEWAAQRTADEDAILAGVL